VFGENSINDLSIDENEKA